VDNVHYKDDIYYMGGKFPSEIRAQLTQHWYQRTYVKNRPRTHRAQPRTDMCRGSWGQIASV